MNNQKKQLEELISNSRNIVFFGGAGISTESGIPDFRSPEGLFSRSGRSSFPWPAETILSAPFFQANPEVFFRYYRQHLLHPQAKPNAAHVRLAQLEQSGKLTAVITQNVDGLHQAAGSRNVLELHGSVHRNVCRQCTKTYGLACMLSDDPIPTCLCGGRIKPGIVLYGEMLDPQIIRLSIQVIAKADLLIVGGTSLVVYPAAGLVDYADHCQMVIINQAQTSYDHQADLLIHAPIGETLGLTPTATP